MFEAHTVFENLELAMDGDRRVWRNLFKRLTGAERDRIEEVIGLVGLKEHVGDPAGTLSHGEKQWLEIGMLLMQNPAGSPGGRTGGGHDPAGIGDDR